MGNEKTTYNDRTMPHLVFDVERAEYGNFLLFPVWDERTTGSTAAPPTASSRKPAQTGRWSSGATRSRSSRASWT